LKRGLSILIENGYIFISHPHQLVNQTQLIKQGKLQNELTPYGVYSPSNED